MLRRSVPFEQLAAFPALRDLSLQCNGLRHLANPGGFATLEVPYSCLLPGPARQEERCVNCAGSSLTQRCSESQVLDLSVNAIAAEDIAALGALPCLKELDVSRCETAQTVALSLALHRAALLTHASLPFGWNVVHLAAMAW